MTGRSDKEDKERGKERGAEEKGRGRRERGCEARLRREENWGKQEEGLREDYLSAA